MRGGVTSVLGLVYRLAKLGPNRIVVFLNDVVDNLGKKKGQNLAFPYSLEKSADLVTRAGYSYPGNNLGR